MPFRTLSRVLTVIMVLAGFAHFSTVAHAAAAPPVGGYFSTLAPGSALPSDATCAQRVRRSPWEPRPENSVANQRVATSVSVPGFTPEDGGTDRRARQLADRVTGDFKGTTDEIIQWAGCKWGFNDDTIRAQAVSESTWYQSTTGDRTSTVSDCPAGYAVPCPQSFGVLQVKATAWGGTFPLSRDVTAFNIDYALMVRRVCYEGWMDWLYAYPGSTTAYEAGDEWGCIGFWYSGNWYGSGTQSYIDGVKQHFANKPWRLWSDRSGGVLTAGSVTLSSSPTTAAPGATFTVNWTAPADTTSTKDWIGMYKVGAANTAYGEWHRTGGAASGSTTFKAPAVTGTYEFRYLPNDGYTSVGTSNAVTVGSTATSTSTSTTTKPTTTSTTVARASTFTVTATPSSVPRGGRIDVSWTTPSGQALAKDWIALFKPGTPNTSYGEWHYTGGATTGKMSFTAPTTAGTYEFRFLPNDGYTSVATSPSLAVT